MDPCGSAAASTPRPAPEPQPLAPYQQDGRTAGQPDSRNTKEHPGLRQNLERGRLCLVDELVFSTKNDENKWREIDGVRHKETEQRRWRAAWSGPRNPTNTHGRASSPRPICVTGHEGVAFTDDAWPG